MATDPLRQAKYKAQLVTVLRHERERAAEECRKVGWDLLGRNPGPDGMSQQEACEFCADAISALPDEQHDT